jgi:hypothetical protein
LQRSLLQLETPETCAIPFIHDQLEIVSSY